MASQSVGGSGVQFERLREGALSLPDVVFQSVVNQAPGAAVALNFFFAVAFAGSGFPLGMLLGLIGTLFLTNTLAQFSKHLSSSAGFGAYAARGLGPRYGSSPRGSPSFMASSSRPRWSS